MDIKDYTIEQIVAEFESGDKFLTEAEYEVLRHADKLREKQTMMLEAGYHRIMNHEDEDYPYTDEIEDDVRGAMYDHAYEQGLEWDGKNFWEASSC